MNHGSDVLVPPYQTKVEQVADALRLAIASGELRPGDWIRAEEWARRLKTSATPIREAARQLEAAGVVKIHPHRGIQVAKPSRSEFVSVYRMRAALESLAIEIAVERLSREARRELCRQLAEIQKVNRQAGLDHDLASSRQSNRSFHMTLYEASGSERLVDVIRGLWAVFPFDTLLLIPERLVSATKEHDQLIAAVRRGDATRATVILRDHIEGTVRSIDEGKRRAYFTD